MGIRSSLRAGLSATDATSVQTWINGAITGLEQGIASLAINYATSELGINPLIANLGISAIGSILEGVFVPPAEGDTRNIMERVMDSYGKNLLTMLGYNPLPDQMNQEYWQLNADGTAMVFNDGLYNSALESYYAAKPWTEATYIAQVLDFTDIAREQGIEIALNTYATGLFNGIAVNKITTLANVAIGNIGTYFKTKIDSFMADPASSGDVKEVSDGEGNKIIEVGVRNEETGEIELTGRFKEIFDEEYSKHFYTFKGYELGGQFNAFGDWAVDTFGKGGLVSGEYTEWWNGTEFYNEIVRNEQGLSVPRKVTIADLETGTYTTIDLADPVEKDIFGGIGFDALLDSYSGGTINTTEFDLFYENQVYRIDFGDIDPAGIARDPQITYYLFNSRPVMTIEKTDIEYYKSDGTFEVLDNGAEITKMLNEDGTIRSIKMSLSEVFKEPIEKVLTKNVFGEMVTFDFTEEGAIAQYTNGKVYMIARERFGEFTMDVPANMTMFDHKAEVWEYREKIIEQFPFDHPFSDTKTTIYDDFRVDMQDKGIFPEDLTIDQELFRSGELGIKVVDGIRTASGYGYGMSYGHTREKRHILTSNFKDENYAYLKLDSKEVIEDNDRFTVSKINGKLYDVTKDGQTEGPGVSGRECVTDFWIGEGTEAKKGELMVTLYSVVDPINPDNVSIVLKTRLDMGEGSMYMYNVTSDSYSKGAADDTERKRSLDKLNIYLKDGMGMPGIDFEIPLGYGGSAIETGNAVLDMQVTSQLNRIIKEEMWK